MRCRAGWTFSAASPHGAIRPTSAVAHVSQGFASGAVDRGRSCEQFAEVYRDFQAGLAAEVNRTAQAIYQQLQAKPMLLNSLRGGKVALDVAAIGGTVAAVGLGSLGLDIVLVPLVASVTHQLVELLGQQVVDFQREQTRLRQQSSSRNWCPPAWPPGSFNGRPRAAPSSSACNWRCAGCPPRSSRWTSRIRKAVSTETQGGRVSEPTGDVIELWVSETRPTYASGSSVRDPDAYERLALADPVRCCEPCRRRLRGLERSLRAWLDGPHRYPLSTLCTGPTLEGLANDLRRQAEALDVDGRCSSSCSWAAPASANRRCSTPWPAAAIAQASFQRPTTRDPVVYYHESVRTDRLDPALRHCRLGPARSAGACSTRSSSIRPTWTATTWPTAKNCSRMLPVADVVLYVGSQEKYHDQIVWDLFLTPAQAAGLRLRPEQVGPLPARRRSRHAARRRPASRPGRARVSRSRLLFRTVRSSGWIKRRRASRATLAEPPQGEQFLELSSWLEMGLNRLEIEAIKARGVSQLLAQTEQVLHDVAPPDLADVAAKVKAAWAKPLSEEATATADVLVNSLEPYQSEIEHHFAPGGPAALPRPDGLVASARRRARYVGSTLRTHPVHQPLETTGGDARRMGPFHVHQRL